METITITKRIINGKEVFHKRFDDYDNGFYGKRISKREYMEAKESKHIIQAISTERNILFCERLTYRN